MVADPQAAFRQDKSSHGHAEALQQKRNAQASGKEKDLCRGGGSMGVPQMRDVLSLRPRHLPHRVPVHRLRHTLGSARLMAPRGD